MRPGFDFAGKRVLVVGLARTGAAVSLFAAAYGATVTATDEKPESALGEVAARLRAAGVTLELGGHPPSIFFEQDLIVVSPGVPANLAPMVLAHVGGIPVWSEIELAWRFLRGKLVAITGSNGKTTTTSLVAHILKVRRNPDARRRKHRRAADFACRAVDGFDGDRRGSQQLPARDDRGVSPGNRRVAESHTGPSRPPRYRSPITPPRRCGFSKISSSVISRF